MTYPDAVLVTGASTGIGKAIVEQVSGEGHRVFAAVRDLSTVEPHPLVTPIRLDVTSVDEALAAAATVREGLGDSRLRGIVNNAGIAVAGPLEFIDIEEVRQQLDINVIGQLAVTQAFLPLLRDHGVPDPRIVFMGSMASRFAGPFLGPYSASKFGLLAMATSLRRELRDWGFKVTVVEPGNIATPIWAKAEAGMDATDESLPQRGRELYGTHLAAMRTFAQDGRKGSPPSAVAKVVHTCLFARHPRTEYLVGADARVLVALNSVLPASVFDRMFSMELRRRQKRTPRV
jgi:NAD(P)-dependent dehydrogenase (short-subunit alcohol dehydrogenase family)